MIYLAVREDDMARAESLVTRVGKDYGDSAMFAVAERDSATVALLLGEAKEKSSVGEVGGAVDQVGSWLWELPAAESFARAAVARPERPGLTNLMLAHVLLAQGRWTAADSALVRASRATDAPPAPLLRGVVAALPFLAVPRSKLEAIRADVSAWDSAGRVPGGSRVLLALLPPLRLYALGLLDSRLGDAEGALRAASQLESYPVVPDNVPVVKSLAAAVRADVALAAHRPADALKALEAVHGQVPIDLSLRSPFGEDYARFLRAEALLATGKEDEARRWLETGFVGTPDDIVFQAQVSFLLGDIYDRAGERKKATDSYGRTARLWQSCDPGLRPMVDEARARLARLTAEPQS